MASSNQTKFENICNLLSQHNLVLVNQNIDDFKCIICQKILRNACQGYCGCNFCENCINAHLISGERTCPGDTEGCKSAHLSNVMENPRMNQQISQLVVKCPGETCRYQTQLKNMEEHLRSCPKISLECPFYDLGCDQGKVARDKLNKHMKQQTCHHSKMLIDVIDNLKNEMVELKRNVEKTNSEVEQLKKSDNEKASRIELMGKEINTINLENVALKLKINDLGNKLNDKVDKVTMDIKVKAMEDDIKRKASKVRKAVLEKPVGDMGVMIIDRNEQLTCKIDARKDEMIRGLGASTGIPMTYIDEKHKECQLAMVARIDGAVKYLELKIEGGFAWPINGISDMRKNGGSVEGEYFNGCAEPYKMRLFYWNHSLDEFHLYLNIFPGESDEYLQWPFTKLVSISIADKKSPQARKTVTHHCIIEKPLSYQTSDEFVFYFKDFNINGWFRSDCFTVRCVIAD